MGAFDFEYEGGAFHPQLDKGKTGGTVMVDAGCIAFTAEKISFQLPLDGIEMKMGGAANRLVFFTHPAYPEQTIYCADAKILNNTHLKSQRATRAQRADIGAKRFKARVFVAVALVLIMAVLGGLYFFKDPAVGFIAANIPPELEDKLGDSVIGQYRTSHSFIDSAAMDEHMQLLVAPLVESIASERYDFTFYIVEDPTLNAFALPGGHVVLHTGLILEAERPEEIVGVIAHEIAHVTEQHGVRTVLEGAGLYVVLNGLFGDVTGIAAVLMNNGAFLLKQQFSRDFEREADAVGVDYLVNAGIDPSGLYDFFAKLKAVEAESAMGEVSDALSLLSTHPATSERMEALQKIIDAHTNNHYQKMQFDLAAFQSLIMNATQYE